MIINNEFLNDVARDLPIIRPIKEFIHLNLLLPYQYLPFWDALKEVSLKLEANPLPTLNFYRQKIKSHDLPIPLLKKKLQTFHGEKAEEAMSFILRGELNFIHHDTRLGKLHECWNELLGINIIEMSDGMLIKWVSMFLDQGISHWQMPDSGEKSFYHCIRDLMHSSLVKPAPFNAKNLNFLFPDSPEEAIHDHLNFLCPDENLHAQYAKESVMTLRGWAGLIYNIQQSPNLLPFARQVSLIDFLSVKLVLERAWISNEIFGEKKPDFSSLENHKRTEPFDEKTYLSLRACQETLEEATYDKFLKSIHVSEDIVRSTPTFQAVFCMDDRESLLRGFLESTSSRIETFGTAGHFGIECLYQHPDDAFPKKQCPAPVAAKVFIEDIYKNNVRKANGTILDFNLMQPTGNFLLDWFFSHANGVLSAIKLTANLFFPLALKSLKNVKEVNPKTELKLLKSDPPTANKHGVPVGYSLEEMAELVHQQLLLIGFVHQFAPLIFIFGHGSSSENNPYFATYGCGACSGRSGSANARAIVSMANNFEVRKFIAKKYGLIIPDKTCFIAAFHDTCRDVVEIYDIKIIPNEFILELKKFKKYLSVALYKNARERAKLFRLVTYRTVSKQAQKEVLRRSHSFFETRPEMGHTNVAYAMVGRRETTKGLSPDQPCFFQSYDSKIDPDGKLLAITLGAVIPVCSGINLDYFFSRVDNLRFGAGSKLPQNIVGNLGMSHGTESDLLFGLPSQMIEQHQPLRLFVMVEQKPEIALLAIQENSLVKQIVYNNWIHYACFDKDSRAVYVFKNGDMILREHVENQV